LLLDNAMSIKHMPRTLLTIT